MASGKAKTLNLSLHLNPAASEADGAALEALKQWYEECKQSHGNGSGPDVDAEVRILHHDIYLAGLHLHRINPRLCRHVAEALGQSALTIESLVRQLQACGLWPGPSEAEQKNPTDASFSDTQLEQLQQVLARAPAPEQSEQQSGVPDAALAGQLAEQGKQLSVMIEEIQQLRALAEQQALQLQKLKSTAPVSSVPATSRSPAAEEMSVADMDPQFAQMQKIRQKGIF